MASGGQSRASASDEALMHQCRRGSRDAFADLFQRYRQRIYGYFRRRVSSPARAEELAQETFVAVLEAAPRWEQRASFRTWLYGIAFNICMAERRKSGSEPASIVEDAYRLEGGDTDTVLWVRAAVARLDGDHREVLLLREYEELSYNEIATVTGIPVNTVRSRLFRARMALKELLVPVEANRRGNEEARNCGAGLPGGTGEHA